VTFREHVFKLADEMGALVFVCENCEDWPEGSIASAVLYLLALHELGHLEASRGKRKKFIPTRLPILTEEAQAWRWALARSRVNPGPDEWAQILWRLKSYADDRRYKRDPDFDRLLAEAERKAA